MKGQQKLQLIQMGRKLQKVEIIKLPLSHFYIQKPVNNNLTTTKIQIKSHSSDPECEILQQNVNQNTVKQMMSKRIKIKKIIPQISNESKCCIIF
ncbi:unnamed protein product [Paramecium sonneborni]|uniref:Uncharacterized protein n=1 Tax=Paramecium sonneborni TaxID=65129 RepID=A0A8S1N082_9CILI|nr:unnamed protein product [Paramecium sonneborni]